MKVEIELDDRVWQFWEEWGKQERIDPRKYLEMLITKATLFWATRREEAGSFSKEMDGKYPEMSFMINQAMEKARDDTEQGD